MIERAEPLVDRVAAAPKKSAWPGWATQGWGLALGEALLFPVVALYTLGLIGALPDELLSDSWLVILGGKEIVQHGLPAHDALTVWGHGHAWIDQQWLGQLVFYGLYALGGVKLALFGHSAAVGATFVAAVAVARWRGGSVRSVCWIALPAIYIFSWASWNARAQTLALPLFVAVVWLLIRDARSESRRILLVFPALVLWANLHGSVVAGALVVGLYGLVYGIERRRKPLRSWLPRTALLCIGPLACLFASPYALALPSYYADILANPGFREFVTEARDRGATVLLSSHILAETEALCGKVTIIRAGKTVESGSLESMRHLSRTSIKAEMLRDPGDLSRIKGVEDISFDGYILRAQVDSESLGELIRVLGDTGVRSLVSQPPTLEELFLRHYKVDTPARRDAEVSA